MASWTRSTRPYRRRSDGKGSRSTCCYAAETLRSESDVRTAARARVQIGAVQCALSRREGCRRACGPPGRKQSFRNEADMECMACPDKYKHMTSFYQYYSGAKRAPILTIFIGGNHEGSNYLWELYYGGWVADNIYYLGHAGVVRVGGLRLAGLSGIFNGAHYQLGHYERPPYDESSKRSAYHIRELDVFRLSLIQQPVDVVLSHDWPAGIAHHGDTQRLFHAKPFLRSEVGRLQCCCSSCCCCRRFRRPC